MLCGNFIVNGIAFMLYFFFLKLKMLGVDHPSPDSSTPTFIIEPKNSTGPGYGPVFFIQDNSRVAEYIDKPLRQALPGTFPLQGLF